MTHFSHLTYCVLTVVPAEPLNVQIFDYIRILPFKLFGYQIPVIRIF